MTKPHYASEYRRTERLVYLNIKAPITLSHLETGMRALSVDEGWTETNFQNRWSYLSRAVHATVLAGCVSDDDLRPGLNLLPTYAPPPDGKSSVRKSMALLHGQKLGMRKRPAPPSPVIWQAMLDCLHTYGRKTHALANLELVLRATGKVADAPRVMPSADELEQTADRIGMPRTTMRTGVALYRDAREMMIKLDPDAATAFAPIPARHGRRRGLHSLSVDVLMPLLEAAGNATHPEDLDWSDILKAVAPIIHEEYAEWLKRPLRGEQPGDVTPGGIYSTGLVLNRFVAGMILAKRSEVLLTMSLLDLFLPSEAPFDATVQLDPLAIRARARAGRADMAVLHQPARVSLDAMSHLARKNAKIVTDDIGYTVSTLSDMQRLWGLVGGVFRLRMLDSDPASWGPFERAFEHFFDFIRSQQLQPNAERNPCTALDLVSLPQLVCIGLPLLELERQRTREAWLLACARVSDAAHDVVEHPVSAKAYREYAHAAEVLLAAGVYAVDGLRLNNYRCGLLGKHYLIEFLRDAEGLACGIARISTEWTGDRRDPAKTKRESQTRSRRRVTRSPSNRRTNPDWSAAYVPPEALWQYLSEVTLPRVILSGGLPTTATTEDMVGACAFPLFVSRKRMKRGSTKVTRMGSNTVGQNLAGYALWWTARHALGRDVPDWRDLDRGGDFFRALSGHDFRVMTTCFWGQVMLDWAYAGWLTNDSEQTLRDFYSVDIFQRWRESGGDTTHPDHPLAYRDWMLAIKNGEINSVDLTDGTLPLPSAAREFLRNHRRLMGKRPATTARHGVRGVRRARVGQPAPKK